MNSNNDIESWVEIEANDYLMIVFNAINEEKYSFVFVYRGVKFWRENLSFMTHKAGVKVDLGSIVDTIHSKK